MLKLFTFVLELLKFDEEADLEIQTFLLLKNDVLMLTELEINFLNCIGASLIITIMIYADIFGFLYLLSFYAINVNGVLM